MSSAVQMVMTNQYHFEIQWKIRSCTGIIFSFLCLALLFAIVVAFYFVKNVTMVSANEASDIQKEALRNELPLVEAAAALLPLGST